jgi:hypothetical protein
LFLSLPEPTHITPLIKDCLHGDAKAQFALYEQYHKAMYNVAWRIVKEAHEAEDATVTVSGSEDVKVTVRGTLNAKVSGSGDIQYKGNPKKVVSKVSGSGDVTGY